MNLPSRKITKLIVVALLFMLLAVPMALAQGPAVTDGDAEAQYSHRLIIELDSPSLASWAATRTDVPRDAAGRLDTRSAAAQAYVNELKAEQAAFVEALRVAMPNASVSNFVNEAGVAEANAYQIVFNGIAIDPGSNDLDAATRSLAKMDGVKAVYRDYAYTPNMYTSTALINAPTLWNELGGQEAAGTGIKLASMDGGLHHRGAMFQNDGSFSFPEGYPLPDNMSEDAQINNNGKIIVSRAYFRPWDLPKTYDNTMTYPGTADYEVTYYTTSSTIAGVTTVFTIEEDSNVWPGGTGTPHGVHTGGTAGGNVVEGTTYAGYEVGTLSGVAPGAWMLSYRVFYDSVNDDGSFYLAEGLAALDDVVNDGSDVVNNSWGGGPGSMGGAYDPLDTALVNAVNAGVFVSMSAGNAGPYGGTGDHPSDAYINVAASTHAGNLASGQLNFYTDTVALENIPFATASFGPVHPAGDIYNYDFITAMSVNPANFEGCDPWPAGTFDGQAAIISRGACEFGTKVFNAEQAGATFVIVYNHAAGGEALVNMAPGADGGAVTIPSIFIPNSAGTAVVDLYANNGDNTYLEYNAIAFQAGSTPDVIASFSSRGPSVGNKFNPDIAAPGVSILSQGYVPGVQGEERHIGASDTAGFGQAGGTSMAAPHVAGAAALLKEMYPTWTNAEIKSALMSTAKYMDIYDYDGTPAQPLDMGAGRLDLTNAADPGVILSPTALAFGPVMTGTTKSMTITIRNIHSAEETYSLSTLYTGDSFTATTELPGFSLSETSITLGVDESADLVVTFDTTKGWMGDNQGYVVMEGDDGHNAHFPVWARTHPEPTAQVLILDNDASSSLGAPNYISYYTATLEALGYTYDVWDADANFAQVSTIPPIEVLLTYDAILHFTGDNFQPNGTFGVSTALTAEDTDKLTEYVNNGKILISMGQDASWILADTFLFDAILNGERVRDSITGGELPSMAMEAHPMAPPALQDVTLDLSGGAMNQYWIDELSIRPDAYVPPAIAEENAYYNPVPLFVYPDPTYRMEDGIVAVANRDQPTIESPGIASPGRTIFTAFGLEGLNPETRAVEAQTLLGALLSWGMDDPTVDLSLDSLVDGVATFSTDVDDAVSYRWSFGDGSAAVETETNTVSYTYPTCGNFTAMVETTNALGNKAIDMVDVNVEVSNGLCTFAVHLSGDNEVPPIGSPAYGHGAMALDLSTNEVYYRFRVQDTDGLTITAAHIHVGGPDENGGVVLPLYNSGTDGAFDGDMSLVGSAVLTPAQVAEMVAGNYYVNIHSTANPGGEIRGQIMAQSPASSYVSILGGDDPAVYGNVNITPMNYGSITGTTFLPNTNVNLNVSNANIITANLMAGYDGQGGSVAEALISPTRDSISETMIIFDQWDVVNMMANYYYVDVNTDQGRLVGQLAPASAQDVSLTLDVTVSDDGTCGTSDRITVIPGTDVTFCYIVENTGDTTLDMHNLMDDVFGTVFTDFNLALSPGMSVSVVSGVAGLDTSAMYTQSGSYLNEAHFSAYNSGLGSSLSMASAMDSAIVTVEAPSISLDATVSTDAECSNHTSDTLVTDLPVDAFFCYQVTNSGNVTVTTHSLVDATGTILDEAALPLPPGQSSPYFTSTANITMAMTNMATFTAMDVYGNMATAMNDTAIEEQQYSQVRVFHAAPFAEGDAAVNVWINGSEVLTNFVYGAFSSYLTLPEGDHLVAVEVGDTVAYSETLSVPANLDITVAAVGGANGHALDLDVLVDTNTATDTAHLRVAHFAPFAEVITDTQVDIRTDAGDVVLGLAGVPYGVNSGYNPIAGASYDLLVSNASADGTTALENVLGDLEPVTLNNGTSYSLYAIGGANGHPFQVVASFDVNDGTAILPFESTGTQIFLPLVFKN